MFKLWLAVLTLKCTYRQDNSVNWARKRCSNFFLTMKAFCFITLSNLFYHKKCKVQIQLSSSNFITLCTCTLTEFSLTSSPTPPLNVKLQRDSKNEVSRGQQCKEIFGRTPLHVAVLCNRLSIVQKILARYANTSSNSV